MQLIGKDDDESSDEEASTERWQNYVDAYVSVSGIVATRISLVINVFYRASAQQRAYLLLKSADLSFAGELNRPPRTTCTNAIPFRL